MRADPATTGVKLVALSGYEPDQFGPDGDAFDLHFVKSRTDPVELAGALDALRDGKLLAGRIETMLDGAHGPPF